MKLGNVKTLSMKLEDPKLEFEDIAFNQLSIFVGQNGAGKSLVLKMVWCMGICVHNKVMYKTSSKQNREFA